jgi:hypothetical protein
MQSFAPSRSLARSWARGALASVLALAGVVACGSSSPSHVGPDGGNDASAGPDGGQDGSTQDADGGDAGFPQCTATQQCVGDPSFGDWVCLERCAADGGGCPSGTTCQLRSGCCIGTGCSAVSAHVCVPSDMDASADADADAAPDASGSDADGGFPQCTSAQACVGYPSFGDWVCLARCTGADGGECPTGMNCTHAGGCCVGTACSTVSEAVCVTP